MFHIARPEDIKAGRTTDVYFQRTAEILKAKGIDKQVKAEFVAKGFPLDWKWAVLAGIEECVELLKEMDVSVRAMEEGTVFRPLQPVMEIEGLYTHFAIFETALLGLMCQASGVATKAARCRKLAGDRVMLSFGARRIHPAVTPMVERSAFIGGCDGTSVVLSAELLGEEPSGTIPHALMLVIGSTVEATKAFNEVIAPRVRRIALIDTFNDEKFEALNVAEALGQDLFGVRLDTPRSRRGDFLRILEEVRWELDLRGYSDVKLFVSGGIDEAEISQLRHIVDGYGVGTSLSNAPVVDLAMDIIEIEGRPTAKRGKWSGSKTVWRCEECFEDVIVPFGETSIQCSCGGTRRELLSPLTLNGRLVRELPRHREIREYVISQLANLEL